MIELYKKYGCLTVLDMGEEYKNTELFLSLKEEAKSLHEKIKPYEDEIKEIKEKYPAQFEAYVNHDNLECGVVSLNLKRIYWATIYERKRLHQISIKLKIHYKCMCKCGRLHYFNEETIESKPRFCIYPVPISTRYKCSTKAQNATSRKEKKYERLENVVLKDRKECIQSEYYCDRYNDYQSKKLLKKEEELQAKIASLPRKKAKNYDEDYTGLQYESLFVEECIDDHFESQPRYGFTQRHNKVWSEITVYKKYRCKCKLCGNEQLVTCDKFGIYPPTEYGCHAYYGYWSDVYCECHKISSFQWIVCKLLIENKVNYEVEYTFPDLYGIAGQNLLRFDFAIKDAEGKVLYLIECQGEQHYKPVRKFGGEEGVERQKKNDLLKRKYANSHGITLLEISYRTKSYESIRNILLSNHIIQKGNGQIHE